MKDHFVELLESRVTQQLLVKKCCLERQFGLGEARKAIFSAYP